MSKDFLTPVRLVADFTLDDGASFTTNLVLLRPTANRTVLFPDATGALALVPGINGQVAYNDLGRLAAHSSMTFGAATGLRLTNPFGYGQGGGGTVTQSTSKSTGVTLNKPCGQITCNNEALSSGAVATFVLTNSTIVSGDVLILNHISGGTAGSYMLNAQSAAGSASINIRNLSGGSLSEAIVIAFAVTKARTD